MNVFMLIVLGAAAFALQYFLTFVQMKSFTAHYKRLRKMGRVAIGRQKGAVSAGAIVLFAIDDEANILEGSYMQGVTVLARFKKLKGFEGKAVAELTEEDCKSVRAAKPLTKAVLDASKNYTTIMKGGEVATPPSPFQKLTGTVSGFADSFKNKVLCRKQL